MRLYNFLNEKYLSSEITFGFELEGYDSKGTSGHHEVEISKLMEKYGFSGKYKEDDSLSSWPLGIPFEFATDPMKFTPENILKMKNLLLSLKKEGIKTDNTCGFHVHFSFPNMNIQEQRWIVAQLAMDEKARKNFEKLKQFNFFHKEYAEREYLDGIKEAIKNNDKSELSIWLSNDKHRILRIHPQGTIEWRGPRRFLDKGNPETILEFMKKLHEFVSWMRAAQERTVIGNLTKNDIKNNHHQTVDEIYEYFIERALKELKNKKIGDLTQTVFSLALKMITAFINSHSRKNKIKRIENFDEYLKVQNFMKMNKERYRGSF